jgi:hypothetical protein
LDVLEPDGQARFECLVLPLIRLSIWRAGSCAAAPMRNMSRKSQVLREFSWRRCASMASAEFRGEGIQGLEKFDVGIAEMRKG